MQYIILFVFCNYFMWAVILDYIIINMCYSKKLSLQSFSLGIISSLLLIHFGNEKSSKTNITIGIFFMFVSIMQLLEYLLWSDIECTNGQNKFASTVGPLFNHFQPIVLLVLSSYYLQSNGIISNDFLILTNVLYSAYVMYEYYYYVSNKKNECVKLNEQKHLDWNWKYDFNYYFYNIVMIINVINFCNNKNFTAFTVASYALLLISINKFNKNIGEFWCLMVTGVPLLNIFMQKVLKIDN